MKHNTAIPSELIPEKALDLFNVNHFLKNKIIPSADIIAHDPLSFKRLPKERATAKSGGDALQKRIIAAEDKLYSKIRPKFLERELLGGEFTLKHYLSLDLPFLKKTFPKAFGDREITALLQYAGALNVELDQCTSADDFLPALRAMNADRNLELAILRMVSDSLSELKQLGILSINPLPAYLAGARKNANRVKAEQQKHSNVVLPSYAAAAILNEYDHHILQDARYFAVPLSLLGIPAATISALNMSDLVTFDDVLSLKIDSEMVRPAVRLCERPLESTYQVRLLCVHFLRNEIGAWKQKYSSIMGTDLSAKKIPLCAFGCRAQPKRCSPEEINSFLKELLDRCHPGKHGFPTRAYHKTFLVFGEPLLTEKPFHARYLLGQAPETVDERVYISFTNPRLQREMSDLAERILDRMRRGGLSDNVEV